MSNAAALSLGALASRKLESLCRSLGEERLLPEVLRAFDALSASWAGWPLGSRNPWPTDITDDGSPFELSVAFGSAGAQVRILSESQCLPMAPCSTWKAGLGLNRRVASDFGSDTSAFERIVDLFTPPPAASARFLIWHAVVVSAGAPPVFKVYLNPGLSGSAGATAVVGEALERLGLPQGRAFLSGLGAASHVSYFSLDLVPAGEARVKVYVDHPGMGAAYVGEQVRGAGNIEPERASSWVRRLTAGQAPCAERPFQTCFAFKAGHPAPNVTVSVPLRFYVADDAEAIERVRPFLAPADAARLRRAAERIAERPLGMGRGLVTYVSLRQEAEHVTTTLYLSPEVYAVATPRPRPPLAEHAAPVTFLEVRRRIAERQRAASEHPFLRRVRAASSIELVRAIAPRIGFFILGFQDVQRLVHEHTTDPVLKELARVHTIEDAGHDRLYLEDLATLGIPLDLHTLFSPAHARMRDLTYRVLGDATRLRDDRSRLALVLALEAAGHLYFGAVLGLLERLGLSERLRFFGREHAQAEQGHEVFGAGGAGALGSIGVPPEVLREVLEVVDRTFETIGELGFDLEGVCSLAGETAPG